MEYRQGRYSGFIKPLFGLIDLVIINASIFLFEINLNNVYPFIIYITLSWLVISLKNHFYEVQRHTRIIQIIPLLIRQTILFALVLYAFIGFFKQPNISRLALGSYVLTISVLISGFKFLTFYLIKKYRTNLGGNIRNVIVIGKNEKNVQFQIGFWISV
jgi:putative colanic acid biosynthesis UDP-glucose lipid carrier transferase